MSSKRVYELVSDLRSVAHDAVAVSEELLAHDVGSPHLEQTVHAIDRGHGSGWLASLENLDIDEVLGPSGRVFVLE